MKIKQSKDAKDLLALVRKILAKHVGEVNDSFLRRSITSEIMPLLQAKKEALDLYDYKVICNRKNNTRKTIDRNELQCALLIKKKKEQDFRVFEFIVTGGPEVAGYHVENEE